MDAGAPVSEPPAVAAPAVAAPADSAPAVTATADSAPAVAAPVVAAPAPLKPALPTKVGVLLPLTGRFAAPGLEVKKGLELALSQLPPTLSGPITLIYKDTQEDPTLTEKAVDALVETEQVVAIIGPLVSATADAAANAAARHQVPLVVLSQKPNIPQLGQWVFRNFLTSESQIKTLVGYAMDSLGLKRFAMAVPETRYAYELTSLFWDEVQRRGGQVVGFESYATDLKDFGPVARRLGSQYYLEPRQSELAAKGVDLKAVSNKPGSHLLPPIVDFDAIFVPDAPKGAGSMAAALALSEIPVGQFKPSRTAPGMRLLGITSWNSPQLVSWGGEYVEDSLFVDFFMAGSPEPQVQAFVAAFQTMHGAPPEGLAAAGFDALGLLHSVLLPGDLERAQVVAGLHALCDYPGVTGKLSFDQRGELQRTLYVLSVQNRALVALAPAGLLPVSQTQEDELPSGSAPRTSPGSSPPSPPPSSSGKSSGGKGTVPGGAP